MQDEQELSALIGKVYDAALDPSLWTEVLAKAAPFVGGQAAALFSKGAASKTGGVVYDYGADPQFRRLYDFVTAVLDKSAASVAMFDAFRYERDGVVGDQTRQCMRLILPHIRRAVLIGRLIDLKKAEAATFTALLEGISSGLFLVDGNARIVYTNAAGHLMLNAGDVLRAVGGRLVAAAAQVDRTLREIFAAAADGDGAVGIKGITVPLTSHPSEPYAAHVLPLTPGERRTGITYTSVAALFVRKAVLETPSPPEVIAKTYKLTPAELRVLLAIVEVGGIPEVAAALGVAQTTIKGHLGRLFDKTGAGRQADLVKLVAGFSSPLVNG